MVKSILLDLDDTLLEVVSWDAFYPAFEAAWKKVFAPSASSVEVHSAVEAVIDALDANNGSKFTNNDLIFETIATLLSSEISARQVDLYWQKIFTDLKDNWRSVPDARKLVTYAIKQNMQVVIATGMQIPMAAIELKLEWGGIPVDDFNYAFISAIENMHASKPHPSYYYEVLENIERKPEECIMVGDSWDQDIAPAVGVGIPSFWVAQPSVEVSDPDLPLLGRGSLSDLLLWLQGRNNT